MPAGSGSQPLLLSLFHVVIILPGMSQGTRRQVLLSDLLLVLGGCLVFFLRMKSFTIIGLGIFLIIFLCALYNVCLAPVSTEIQSVISVFF